MTMRNDALFEAPLPSMASGSGAAYAEPEFEVDNEWEMEEAFEYDHPEFEDEWEMGSSAYAEPEFEDEWEMNGSSAYAEPEFEDEWEVDGEDPYGYSEFEDESDAFIFRGLRKKIRERLKKSKFGRKLLSVGDKIKKKFVPLAARIAGGAIPGVGGITGPLAGKLAQGLVKEADMEVSQMEAAFFGMNEADPEVAPTTEAMEAALAEFLAAQAAEASSDTEAQAYTAAAIPATINSLGEDAQHLLRRVIPVLIQTNALLTKLMIAQGWEGKQLLRAQPAIMRRSGKMLTKAARAGQPLTRAKAVQATSAATQQVLGTSRGLQAVKRNMDLRKKTAPAAKKRPGSRESEAYCPTCGGH